MASLLKRGAADPAVSAGGRGASYEIRTIAWRSLRDRFAMRISASLKRRAGW
ncbi:hypothetical protein [uncultured Methylobacterium sp.]|jgi:hypothetical protein|uniref:hypothetical protein n=1 Tax=uncultured Methylobacterium sp. TaxID=157278 RepID=UPI002626DBC5|nr:hypothetical protein [uncultured Methylobacterium sp.]